MRILTIATSYPRTPSDWAGRFVRDLNAGFAALGHVVRTLAPWAPGLERDEHDREAGVVRRVGDARTARLFYGAGAEANARTLGAVRSAAAFLAATRAFRRAIEVEVRACDLVVAHWVFPSAWWLAAVDRDVPVIGVVHGADARFLARRVAGAMVARRLRGRLRGLVCVSAGLATRVSHGLAIPPHCIAITPMGIDPAVFAPGAAGEARAPGLVVAAGRLVPEKGFDVLVRACAGLPVRLVVAGDGPQGDGLGELARSLDVPLDLCGVLAAPELARLFRAAAVIVVPSRGAPGENSEGVPLVAIEALACGAAVIGTAVGGLPSILAPAAIAGGDLEDLRRVLLAALREPAGFRDASAASRFDRVAVARRVLGLTDNGGGSSRT